jgi:Fe-S cluster assembly ATPase SufC
VFLASTNTGAVLLPINKVASGGELSRFLLAIKVVLESVSYNRTVIFDEIDSGIGGQTANAVGIRLARMGKSLSNNGCHSLTASYVKRKLSLSCPKKEIPTKEQ